MVKWYILKNLKTIPCWVTHTCLAHFYKGVPLPLPPPLLTGGIALNVQNFGTIPWGSTNGFVTDRWAAYRNQGHFPFSPKFRKFWSETQCNGPFWFGPTGVFGTSFEGGPLRSTQSFQLVRRKCPFPFVKIAVSSTILLHPAYNNNKQMCGGLGLICAARMYRSTGHMEFPKFHTRIFVEWKAPQSLDKNLCWSQRFCITICFSRENFLHDVDLKCQEVTPV